MDLGHKHADPQEAPDLVEHRAERKRLQQHARWNRPGRFLRIRKGARQRQQRDTENGGRCPQAVELRRFDRSDEDYGRRGCFDQLEPFMQIRCFDHLEIEVLQVARAGTTHPFVLLDYGDAGKLPRPIVGTTAPPGNEAAIRAALEVSPYRNDIQQRIWNGTATYVRLSTKNAPVVVAKCER